MWKKITAAAAILLLVAGALVFETSRPPETVVAAGLPTPPSIAPSEPAPAASTAPALPTRDAAPDDSLRYPFVVRGRALDAVTLAPVAGALPELAGQTSRNRPHPAIARPSGADGVFELRLRFLDDRFPELRVFAPDHAPLVRQVFLPGESTARRDGVDLGDFRLDVGTTLRGVVLDSLDRPVPHAQLFVTGTFQDVSSSYFDGARAIGESRDDGSFAIPNCRCVKWSKQVVLAHDARGCGGIEVEFGAGREAVDGLVIRLQEPSPIDIEVVDDHGAAIAGATVLAVPFGKPFSYSDSECAISAFQPHVPSAFQHTTDVAGRLRIEELSADGPVAISAAIHDGPEWDDYRETRLVVPRGAQGAARQVRLTLAPKMKRPQSSFVPPPDTTPKIPIAGTVVDDSRKPVPDAKVYVIHKGAWTPSAGVRTDDAGRFAFDVAEDDRLLHVVLPGGWFVWRWTDLDQKFTPGDQEIRVVGERTPVGHASVTINVHDALTGEGLALFDAGVWSRIHDGNPPALVGPDPYLSSAQKGRVLLEACRVGKWRLYVRPDGAPSATFDFDVAPDDHDLNFEFAIAHGASVSGHIRGEGISDADLATALSGAQIYGYETDGVQFWQDIKENRLALEGRRDFRFDAVPPRRIRLHLQGQDLLGNAFVDASKGGDLFVEMVVTRPAKLRLEGIEAWLAVDPTLRLLPGGGIEGVDDTWLRLKFFGVSSKSKIDVPPGPVRYQLFSGPFTYESDSPWRWLKIAMSGTLDLKAGETTDLVLPPPDK